MKGERIMQKRDQIITAGKNKGRKIKRKENKNC